MTVARSASVMVLSQACPLLAGNLSSTVSPDTVAYHDLDRDEFRAKNPFAQIPVIEQALRNAQVSLPPRT